MKPSTDIAFHLLAASEIVKSATLLGEAGMNLSSRPAPTLPPEITQRIKQLQEASARNSLDIMEKIQGERAMIPNHPTLSKALIGTGAVVGTAGLAGLFSHLLNQRANKKQQKKTAAYNSDLAIGILNVIEIHENGWEKSAGIFDLVGKALPYAGKYMKAVPTRIAGWWNKMRGGKGLVGAAEKGLAAESPEVAAALAQRAKGVSALAGANKELFGSAVPKFDPTTGKRIWGGMRGEVSDAFNAMPKWQQNTVKGLGWAGTTAGTIALGPNSVGGQIHGYVKGKEGELSGARQAQDMAAQAAKQLQNMPLMDRLKLGLGTVFSPTSTGEGIGNFIQSIGRPPGWTPPQTAPGVRSPSSSFFGAAPRASAAVDGMS